MSMCNKHGWSSNYMSECPWCKDAKGWAKALVSSSGSALEWTEVEPAVPGWYWIKAPNLTPRVDKFYQHSNLSCVLCDLVIHGYNYHGKPYQFAGPIPAPSEKPNQKEAES